MPSKPYNPMLKTVYLDTSTISLVLRSDQTNDRYRSSLREAIESISSKANLCLTHNHLIELAGMNAGRLKDIGHWLDSLNIVWMKEFHDIEKLEIESLSHALQDGLESSPMVFYPSFLSSFPMTGEKSSEYLRSRHPLTDCIFEASKPEWRDANRRRLEVEVRRRRTERNRKVTRCAKVTEKMKAGPSESAYRSRFQTTLCGFGQKPWS